MRERERVRERESDLVRIWDGAYVHMCVCACAYVCVPVSLSVRACTYKLCRTSLVQLKLCFLLAFLREALVLGLGLGLVSVWRTLLS